MLDAILAALPELRRQAESLMTATATIYRKTGQSRDGVLVTALWTVAYEGRCKIQTYEPHEQPVGTQTGASATVQRSQVHVPVGDYMPEPGDVVKLTDSRDPHMIGRLWRITVRWPAKEHATAYRAHVDELLGDDMADFEGVA